MTSEDKKTTSELIFSAAHSVVRNSRRAQGLLQLRGTQVTGAGPEAVVRALRSAALNRPSVDERAWIRRIELMRALLSSSPQALEVTDFGAGVAHVFDDGSRETAHTLTRTLGHTTSFSKPPQWAYLLFRIVRELRPALAVELGSCVGISASYLAAAMELNDFGHVITMEGAEVLARRTERTLEELLLDRRASVVEGRFDDTLEPTVRQNAPVGLAFIDGHHIESATVDYMNAIMPFVADEAILIFDDINWSDGMRNAWRTVVHDQRFAITIDLRSVGLAVVSASASTRQSINASYY